MILQQWSRIYVCSTSKRKQNEKTKREGKENESRLNAINVFFVNPQIYLFSYEHTPFQLKIIHNLYSMKPYKCDKISKPKSKVPKNILFNKYRWHDMNCFYFDGAWSILMNFLFLNLFTFFLLAVTALLITMCFH